MLGFGKKKDKTGADTPASEAAGKAEDPPKGGNPPKGGKQAKKDKGDTPKQAPQAAAQKASAKSPKKRFSIKKIIIILVILGLLGGGGYAGYAFFFKSGGTATERIFVSTPMPHLTLPKEMLKFSFDHFPQLYDAFVQYETEMSLLEQEIARIDAISAKYPDQQKISDRQKKIWEKGKNTLLKEFAKLEKPVKETFVLFQVNPKEGLTQIDALAADLTASAKSAIDAAQELTADIKAMAPKAPEGLIQGTLFKLKKKFL